MINISLQDNYKTNYDDNDISNLSFIFIVITPPQADKTRANWKLGN